MTSYGYFCAIDKVRHRWLVAPHGVLVLHTEIHTHDLHQAVCTITLHVTVTFSLIRGTNFAEFFSCAMFGDGQCVAVHPFLLLSWILLLFALVTSPCIWPFTTVRTCLPTFPLNSQELAVSSSTARVSTCLHHPLILPASSLFSHCPHVTATTGVLHLFAFRL